MYFLKTTLRYCYLYSKLSEIQTFYRKIQIHSMSLISSFRDSSHYSKINSSYVYILYVYSAMCIIFVSSFSVSRKQNKTHSDRQLLTGMVIVSVRYGIVYTCMGNQGQAGLWECKNNLMCIGSSRPARTP